jgi:hypothetical protein
VSDERDMSIDEIVEEDLSSGNELADQEPAKQKYVEFLGKNPGHGTAFYGAGRVGHIVTPKQIRDAWGVEIPKKLEWTKMAGGPHKDRMLVSAEGLSDEALASFDNDSMFRVVEL